MTRYHGKVCSKHPELAGERLRSNRTCTGCHYDKLRTTQHARWVRRRELVVQRHPEGKQRYYGLLCAKHPEAKGERRANSKCIKCHSEASIGKAKKRDMHVVRARKRKLAKIQRVPQWADHAAIAAVYRAARARGMVVDHIVPLRGATVSGLHVEYNLQLMTSSDNDRKSNKLLEEQ